MDAKNLDISRGIIPGFRSINKFGRSDSIGTSYGIVSIGAPTKANVLRSTPTRIKANSTDANDTVLGTGARKIMVEGLDENWARRIVEIKMAGTSDTALSCCRFYRIDRAWVEESGTYTGSNIGIIDVEDESSNLMLRISASVGQTRHAVLTVQRGDVGYMSKFEIQVEANKTVDARLCVRDRANNTNSNFGASRIAHEFIGVNTSAVRTMWLDHYIRLDQFCDVWVEARVTTGTAKVKGNFTIHFEETSESLRVPFYTAFAGGF